MRYYIDMDGVLVKYQLNDYLGDKPKYLTTDYFKYLQPDTKMLNVIQLLQQTDDVIILTRVTDIEPYTRQHIINKLYWLHKHCPFVNTDTNFIATTTTKANAVELLEHRDLTATDILIDDFNPNLIDWTNHKGTAIKYGNGINNIQSFKGITLPQSLSTFDIISTLRKDLAP